MTDVISQSLPPKLALLYGALPHGQDVMIPALHGVLFPDSPRDHRDAQQWLGPYLTKLNRRIAKHKLAVKPGRLRGSYRLVSL